MFYKRVVQKALKSTWKLDSKPGLPLASISRDQDSLVSKVIYDIFGGEILKTPRKKGWHFYNRINGDRIDLSGSRTQKSIDNNWFEDIPATPAETSCYYDNADYLTFLMRFVRAFEEAVGLKRYNKSLTT
ncbi:MAG TPA: hypothetical protein VMV47_08695 [Bacteroidales bacterium]|nr:hypothetical protein [Bacteroidales bacterium]